ncbi:MAG: 8-amino-7-oxononanoate synthase [Pelagibacteraceae bacterium]|nr:8-amino-7-oxononanoate synthase [Pelagibacteraceae bacterium]|tara:strand:+ start:6195 stop:7376 length:1182 start_codon:yes stop_codon:yes gene_type:complete
MKKFNFDQIFLRSILELRKKNLDRSLKSLKKISSIKVKYKDKILINFSSNDYLGLSQNKIMKNDTIRVIKKHGIGSGSSRLVSGNFDFHEKIESLLAKKKRSQSSIIFSTGYLANYSVLSSILSSDVFTKTPIVFSDKLNHQCIYEGCKNKKINFLRFKHNDMNHLEYLLKKNKLKSNPKFILSESVFSMDGDFADIKNLVYLKKKYNSFLFLDEAHATGIYGNEGFGFSTKFKNDIDCVTGTFSKAFGSFGAYISCRKNLKSFLINKCPSFIYSTSLPFSLLASIYSAIKIIPKLNNERKKLIKNSFIFRNMLKKENFNIGNSQTNIIPIIIGNTNKTILISKKLEKKGIYIVPIRPPSVPSNTSRLRISISSNHSQNDIKKLFNLLKNLKI